LAQKERTFGPTIFLKEIIIKARRPAHLDHGNIWMVMGMAFETHL